MPRGHDLDAIAAAVGPGTRLVYLCNPNNPTGTWFHSAELRAFLEQMPAHVIVVVDEAYLEYVHDPALSPRWRCSTGSQPGRHPHLLQGLRPGGPARGLRLRAARPARGLERLRESFNVGIPGLVGAEAALADSEHLARVRAFNTAEGAWLGNELLRRGLGVAPSQTNFLLVDFGRPVAAVQAALVERGIVPRPMAGYGLPDCLA
jgi:histidinol-phosphate aminotransferase